MPDRLRHILATLFRIDLRSLALFRIALGGVVAFDLATRAVDRVAHYTDQGILPATVAADLVGRVVVLSPFYHASASSMAVSLLLLAGFAAAVCLALGLGTRVATILCWVFVVGLQVRNPYVSRFGGDNFLTLLLFWSIFLPLGARLSLDARRRPAQADAPQALLSVPGAVLLLQIFVLYFTTGWTKSGPMWETGRALWYALHLDQYAMPLGVWLREQDAWMGPLTWGALWFERLGPFLPFVPWRNDGCRMLAVIAFIGFHATLAAMMYIGWFPLFCGISWLVFIPGAFWDDWWPRLRGKRPRALPGWPPLARQGWIPQALAGVCGAYVALYLVIEAGPFPIGGQMPAAARLVGGKVLRLHQNWNMFSPDPPELDVWPRIEGVLADGSRVDLLQDRPLDETKPELVIAIFPSFRWRQLFESGWEIDDPREVQAIYKQYARYLCDSWESESNPGSVLRRVRVHHVKEATNPLGPAPVVVELLAERECRPPRQSR